MENNSSSDDSFEEQFLYDNIIDPVADNEFDALVFTLLNEALQDNNDEARPNRGGSIPGLVLFVATWSQIYSSNQAQQHQQQKTP